jgi:autotransporter-associated beta strand protein
MLQLGDGLSGRDGALLSSGSIANNGTLSFDLFGSQTYAGVISGSGNLLVASGSLALAPGASVTSTAGTMHVGQSTTGVLTIGSGASVNIGGELDINFQSTASGYGSTLNLQGGTLTVSGPMTVGHARMDTSPSDTNALVMQTGGLPSAGGTMTIGLLGVAQSIYNISGGQLTATGGIIVGAQGNGVLNITGSASLVSTGSGNLFIGGDPTGATSGSVNLSAGTLLIGGDTLLGNSGIGTLTRTGGVLSASGNLIAGGAGTLVLNGSANSVATYFGGQVMENGLGTLVVVPVNGLLGSGSETVTFGTAPSLTNNILGSWSVQETSGSNSSGDFLTVTGTAAPFSLATAVYSGSSLSTSTGTSTLNLSGSNLLTVNKSAYAIKFGSGSVTTINSTLTLGSGGMILNGATLGGSGSGVINLYDNIINDTPVTGMIFAGSTTASTIALPMKTSVGVVKFGIGTLVLAANNLYLLWSIVVSSGVLDVIAGGALGSGGVGNEVLVTPGATIEFQGNITTGGVLMGISGSGVAGVGALRNLQDNNTFAGSVTLLNNTQIGSDSGTLTILGPIQGSYNLVKTGTGTLALTADSSALFSGGVTVAAGAIDVSNSGGLGSPAGGGVTTIDSGASLTIHGNIALPQTLVISGSGLAGAGALVNIQGNNALTGAVQLAGATQIGVNAGILELASPVSGNYGLTKTGSGTLLLAAANTFSGPLTVATGILSVLSMNNSGSAGPLGLSGLPITLGTSGGTSGGTATFDYAGYGDTSTRAFKLVPGSTAIFQVDNYGSVLTLNGSTSGGGSIVATGFGGLTLGGPVSGSGCLTMAGYGQLTIAGTAAYSGSTTVSQGVLAIVPGGCLSNTSSINLAPGTLLQLTNSGGSQLSSAAAITLQGSAIQFSGNAAANFGQSVGNLLLGPGENDITLSVSTTGAYQPYLHRQWRRALKPAGERCGNLDPLGHQYL